MVEISETVKNIASIFLGLMGLFLIFCLLTGNDGEIKAILVGVIAGLFAALGVGNVFLSNKTPQ